MSDFAADPRRELVVKEALSWLGTPYHHKQHVKGAGVDCVWFPIMCYRPYDLLPADFDPGFYTRDWFLHKSAEIYLNGVEQHARKIEEKDAQIADFAMISMGRTISHGAILLGDGMIIHASAPNKKVEIASILEDGPLRRRLHSFWTPFK